jgi:hypothetical protein
VFWLCLALVGVPHAGGDAEINADVRIVGK